MGGKELNNIPPEPNMSAARWKRPKEELTEFLKFLSRATGNLRASRQPGLAFKIVKLARVHNKRQAMRNNWCAAFKQALKKVKRRSVEQQTEAGVRRDASDHLQLVISEQKVNKGSLFPSVNAKHAQPG